MFFKIKNQTHSTSLSINLPPVNATNPPVNQTTNPRRYSLISDVTLQSHTLSKSSHELKNVFITISNILSSFQISPSFTAIEQKNFSFLRSLCNFGLSLIQDIHTYDKLDYASKLNKSPTYVSDLYITNITSFNLIEMLDFCLKMFQARQYFDNKNISYLTIKSDYKINTETKITCINQTRLRQVIINLLSNSYKFTQRGEIILSCYYCGTKKIRISVKDTGTGMSVSYIKSLFEPYTVDGSNQKYNMQGSGLGLCIVKDILDAFDIKLNYTSQYGKGTEFWFDLDVEDDDKDEEEFTVVDQKEIITKSIMKMMNEINSLDREGVLLKQKENESDVDSCEKSSNEELNEKEMSETNRLNHSSDKTNNNINHHNDNMNNSTDNKYLTETTIKKQKLSYSKTTNTNPFKAKPDNKQSNLYSHQ